MSQFQARSWKTPGLFVNRRRYSSWRKNADVDHSFDSFGLAVNWGLAGLAVQPLVGLLPKRRAGFGGCCASGFAVGWKVVNIVIDAELGCVANFRCKMKGKSQTAICFGASKTKQEFLPRPGELQC